MNKNFIYEGRTTREISFPIGGIGSGSIGIGGNGRFTDIEIFNQPNKGSSNGFTHFAIKAEDETEVIDARVLNSDMEPGYVGKLERPNFQGYGFGPDRSDLTGLPHFEASKFKGTFPLCEIQFMDDHFPGEVTLTAFNPFIPTNEDDSSIPGGFFEVEVKNTHHKKLSFSIALSCNNFYGNKWGVRCVHEPILLDGATGIYLSNDGDQADIRYGDLSIMTDCDDVSLQQYWYRGNMFDSLTTFWQDFTRYGNIKNRIYDEIKVTHDFVNPCDDMATLVAKVSVDANETKKVKFVLTWNMPHMSHHWEITAFGLSKEEIEELRKEKWKNYYATLFATSRESATYAINHFDRLYEDTKKFRDTLFSSSLSKHVLDAISSNLAVLKSPTCLRLEDGSFYGFEGCHAHMGACDGTCTHVWSYAYALAFLFPQLERSARTIEYTHSVDECGGMDFRVQIPLRRSIKMNFRPCVDGQFGTVMRVYREFMISGDITWLRSIWPQVKRSIEFAWSEENMDKWDLDQDGILEGRQHHTLDMELFGANSWLSGMYLGGLKAAAYLAEILGEQDKYDEYMSIFEQGKARLNVELFNGEYFIQNINLNDKNMLLDYDAGVSIYKQSSVDEYWNAEQNEIKYQIGEGCLIDQVLGQWHADLIGLGEIFEKEKVRSALASIYKYNHIETMRNHVNPCRVFALNDEGGTIICSYPEGRRKPFIPIPYAEETMTGFEYANASMMARYGLLRESETCVQSIRNRYDGERRNPWSEIECGSNYARSMASYALLLVHSGFEYDMYRKRVGFKPIEKGNGRFFWSLDSGWGYVEFIDDAIHFKVLYGSITLKSFSHNFESISLLYLNDEEIRVKDHASTITFEEEVLLKECRR